MPLTPATGLAPMNHSERAVCATKTSVTLSASIGDSNPDRLAWYVLIRLSSRSISTLFADRSAGIALLVAPEQPRMTNLLTRHCACSFYPGIHIEELSLVFCVEKSSGKR